MARPLKNNADYFSHDNNMRNDTKILALRSKFGFEGYAVWNMLLEVLTDKEDFKISLGTLEMELLAGDFRIDSKKLKEIINYLIEIELLINDYDTDVYYSKNLIKRLRPVIENRERKREWAEKKWEKESKTELKTSKTKLSTSKSMQSKVKESKVKESKSIQECELVSPPKDTYKTKHMIAKQKGIKLKRTPRTSKQEKTTEALKALDYYREKAQEIHGMQFLKVKDDKRNKAVRKLAVRASTYINLRELIDWWIDGAGEWAEYEPEPCFSTKIIERFKNNKNKKDKTHYSC